MDIENVNDVLNELKIEYNDLHYKEANLIFESSHLEGENKKIEEKRNETYFDNRWELPKLCVLIGLTIVTFFVHYILSAIVASFSFVYAGYFLYKEFKVYSYYDKSYDKMENNTKKIEELKKEIDKIRVKMQQLSEKISKLQDVVCGHKKIDNEIIELCEKRKYSQKIKLQKKSSINAKNCEDKNKKEEEMTIN